MNLQQFKADGYFKELVRIAAEDGKRRDILISINYDRGLFPSHFLSGREFWEEVVTAMDDGAEVVGPDSEGNLAGFTLNEFLIVLGKKFPKNRVFGNDGVITALLLTAQRTTDAGLALGEEVTAAKGAVGNSDRIRLISESGFEAGDLLAHLNRRDPTLLQFSGHGTSDALIAEDIRLTTEKLQPFFAAVRKEGRHRLRVVMLNSCFSAGVAQVIQEAGLLCIGWSRAVFDADAIAFSRAFYGNLADMPPRSEGGEALEDRVISAARLAHAQVLLGHERAAAQEARLEIYGPRE